MKILLIAGHGQGDPGAIENGFQEATLARELVSALSDILKDYAEITVFDTNKNMYKYLKSNPFNFKYYDYVLEVHFNAFVKDASGNGFVTGSEILIHPYEEGHTVEDTILSNLRNLGFTNRGVKTRDNLQNMNICRGSQGVSYALIETCFIDDYDDMKLYISRKKEVVEAIADGIIKGFCLEKQTSTDKFSDISKCYGRKQINELAEMGVINGRADGTYAPKEPITREDVAIIARNVIRYITGK